VPPFVFFVEGAEMDFKGEDAKEMIAIPGSRLPGE
jgi:hypothetical protein